MMEYSQRLARAALPLVQPRPTSTKPLAARRSLASSRTARCGFCIGRFTLRILLGRTAHRPTNTNLLATLPANGVNQ